MSDEQPRAGWSTPLVDAPWDTPTVTEMPVDVPGQAAEIIPPSVLSKDEQMNEHAQKLKKQLMEALEAHIMPVMNEALNNGLILDFNLSPNAIGPGLVKYALVKLSCVQPR